MADALHFAGGVAQHDERGRRELPQAKDPAAQHDGAAAVLDDRTNGNTGLKRRFHNRFPESSGKSAGTENGGAIQLPASFQVRRAGTSLAVSWRNVFLY